MGRHQETRTRLKLTTNKTKSTETEHKVDSKLAKTNPNGQIECIICKVAVKSATLWKVHVNSKLHKERIMLVKQIKSNFQGGGGGTAEAGAKVPTTANAKAMPKAAEKSKETRTTTNTTTTKIQQMLPKTTMSQSASALPSAAAATNVNEKSTTTTTTTNNIDTLLPEKFFDDPVKDAKIRNTEYKDPQADEWERFQREIREASSVSVAIIAGEQIESAYDRDIEEINDQMIHWSRYMNLEARKGALRENKGHTTEAQSADDEHESDDEAVTTTEFSDWRSKAFI